jgi:hypothetical protein
LADLADFAGFAGLADLVYLADFALVFGAETPAARLAAAGTAHSDSAKPAAINAFNAARIPFATIDLQNPARGKV